MIRYNYHAMSKAVTFTHSIPFLFQTLAAKRSGCLEVVAGVADLQDQIQVYLSLCQRTVIYTLYIVVYILCTFASSLTVYFRKKLHALEVCYLPREIQTISLRWPVFFL